MKLRFLFYFLLFTLSKTLCAQNAVVSLDFHQILYVGLDNPISVAVEGVKSQDLIVNITGKGNFIQKVSDGNYTAKVFPQKDTNICFINISVQTKGKVKLVLSKLFKIEFVPKGEAMIGEFRTGSFVKVSDLIKIKKLVYSNDLSVKSILNYRIEKFQIIILPKNSSFEQIAFQGDQLSETAFNKFRDLKNGDILVFDGIRAGNGHTSVALHPIVLTVSNPIIKPLRVEGQTFDGDMIKPYWYPENANQDFNHAPLESEKHGVWNTYLFSDKLQDFYLSQKDSFHFGKLIYTKQFNEKHLMYKVDYGQNNRLYYTLYYENGTIYQEGEVKKRDYETVNYSKFHREIDTSINNTMTAYQNYPLEISRNYYCTGQWKVYHNNGKLKAELNYTTVEDSLRKALYLDVDNPETISIEPPKYLLILLDGPVVFYNKDGKVEETILFKNGNIIKK